MKRFGSFLFDPAAGVLRDAGGEVRLRPKTYALLQVLVEAAPAIVGKDALLDRIWGQGHLGDTSLAQAVSELRRALGDEAKTPRFIETVHRRGYRFVAPVSEAGPAGAHATIEHQPTPVSAPGSGAPDAEAEGAATPPVGRRRALLLLAGVLTVLLAALVTWTSRRGDAASAPVEEVIASPRSVRRLAVMTAVDDLDPTAVPAPVFEVVPSFLAPALQRHARIHVYPEARMAAMERDLGPLTTPETASYRRRLRYLQADHLVVGTIARAGDEGTSVTGFAIHLTLVDRAGRARPLIPAAAFAPDALGPTVVAWEQAVTEALGLPPSRRASGAMVDLDWPAFERVVAAVRKRATDPAAALVELEHLQVDRLNGLRVGRLRVELHLALGETQKARHLVLRMRRRGNGFRRHIWYLNLASQPSAALALLGERSASLPFYAEDWLETMQALEASGRPDDAEKALRALAHLPEDLATSWVGAELRLVEARLAGRLGDHARRHQAATAALALAEPAGQRRAVEAARAIRDADRKNGVAPL